MCIKVWHFRYIGLFFNLKKGGPHRFPKRRHDGKQQSIETINTVTRISTSASRAGLFSRLASSVLSTRMHRALLQRTPLDVYQLGGDFMISHLCSQNLNYKYISLFIAFAFLQYMSQKQVYLLNFASQLFNKAKMQQ